MHSRAANEDPRRAEIQIVFIFNDFISLNKLII